MVSFAKRYKVSETLFRKGALNEKLLRVNTLPGAVFRGETVPFFLRHLSKNESVSRTMRQSDAFAREKKRPDRSLA